LFLASSVGPVGSPQYGRYQVGRLQCEGDVLYENVVTFRKADAIITVPPFEAKVAGDIRFQFQTGFDSATFGSAIMLQNIGHNDGDLIEVNMSFFVVHHRDRHVAFSRFVFKHHVR
jgi:hypothetical protein